jgi:uncharacterized Fe-S cluster-containing MiaB family protein
MEHAVDAASGLPRLWSVVDVLSRVNHLPITKRVGQVTDFEDPIAVATSCPDCREPLWAALREYSATQDPSRLESVSCGCR